MVIRAVDHVHGHRRRHLLPDFGNYSAAGISPLPRALLGVGRHVNDFAARYLLLFESE